MSSDDSLFSIYRSTMGFIISALWYIGLDYTPWHPDGINGWGPGLFPDEVTPMTMSESSWFKVQWQGAGAPPDGIGPYSS